MFFRCRDVVHRVSTIPILQFRIAGVFLFSGVDFAVATGACTAVEAVAEQFAFQKAVGNARRKQLGRDFLFAFLFHSAKLSVQSTFFLLRIILKEKYKILRNSPIKRVIPQVRG